MKWVKIFGFCALLILTLTICKVPPCYAMIEKEDEEYYITGKFGFKVKRIIATETDGTMIWGKQYPMVIIVTLTYINKELWGYLLFNFSETSVAPYFEFRERTYYYEILRDVGDYAKFSTRICYNYTGKGPPFIDSLLMTLSFYGYYNPSKEEVGWRYDCEPIYIELRRETFQDEVIDYISSLETQLNNISNLLYALILTTAILTATTVYLAIRKTKVKVEEK